MKVDFLGVKGTWREIANSARTTVNKEEGVKTPSSSWKRRMLLAEHSPIRQLILKWKWREIPYYVSVHIARHWLGIVHFVRTQRTDRTGIDRTTLPQGALVEHEIEANAQAMINISRRRLCSQASPETREAWRTALNSIQEIEPELYQACVKDCVYRGYCYEYKSCGYHKTEAFQKELAIYRKGINE